MRDDAIARATPADGFVQGIAGLRFNPAVSMPAAYGIVITQTELYLAKICDTQALKDARDKFAAGGTLPPSGADLAPSMAAMTI